MSRSIQSMVAEFHALHGQPIGDSPRHIVNARRRDLRMRLIYEEAREIQDAMENLRLGDIAKELADLVYVTVGTAVEMGIDLQHAVEEVHRSNMTKTPGEKRGDGKVVKGERYRPPDLDAIARPWAGQ